MAPNWKMLAGAALGQVLGRLRQPGDGDRSPRLTRARSDSLWSDRVGVLYQPSDQLVVPLLVRHVVQHLGRHLPRTTPRARTRRRRRARTSRLGVKLDLFDGKLSTRAGDLPAPTKYNERNRDSPDGVPLDNYLLSGKRHASGVDIDLVGRITPQWEVYLLVRVDPDREDRRGRSGVTLTGELEGAAAVDDAASTAARCGTTYQVNAAAARSAAA